MAGTASIGAENGASGGGGGGNAASDPFARPRQLSFNSEAAVESALASVLDAVDPPPPVLTSDDVQAVDEAMAGMVDSTIEAQLQAKMEPCTHTRIPYTEVTLALIKPDALRDRHEREVRYAIHSNGFVIVHEAIVQLTTVRAAMLYEEHRGKPWFEKLIRYVSSAPMLAFVLGRQQAARAWNVIVGPTDPQVAARESPNSLRARFGKDLLRNGVHGSFNAAAGRREVKLLFPTLMLDPGPDPAEARQYFEKNLKRTLINGLTALAKAKPCIQQNVVIRWFADWLLKNNPNSPLIDGKRYVQVDWAVPVHRCTVPAG